VKIEKALPLLFWQYRRIGQEGQSAKQAPSEGLRRLAVMKEKYIGIFRD
jgi:hypothetical protein